MGLKMVNETVRDIMGMVWLVLIGTWNLILDLIFVLPTQVLMVMVIGFSLLIVRDAIVYVPPEFGRIITDITGVIQVVIDGINYAIAVVAGIIDDIKNWL